MTLNRFQLNKVHSPYKSPKNLTASAKRRSVIRKINNGVKFGSASKANLKVVVRVRPENQREIETNQRCVVDIVDDHMLVFDPKPTDNSFFFHGVKQEFRDLSKKQHKQQKFVFENIFSPTSTNQEVFENTTKDLIETILNGYNCSVFAYGATGAGKTFTMLGSPDNHGITFLTVMELYKQIKDLSSDKICEIGVSYLEVYNELVRDLLEPGSTLNLHEVGQEVKVSGLSLHKPKDENELLEILRRGNTNRSQHPTDLNVESSRSHAVFQVFIRQQSKTRMSTASIAKLSMIDLAGSERGTATGYKGARFREGASINKSLLALGNCINALADGKSHIPYRDSKLTRLLKDSIGGNCRSVMIAAVSRSNCSFEDTFNTLKYANRAKTIKTTLKKNLMSIDHHVSQYVKIVESLREEVCSLTSKLKDYEDKEKECDQQPGTNLSMDERTLYEETIENLRKQLEEKDLAISKKNEEEETLLASFSSVNFQLKALQRELLQLESDERLLVLKKFSHSNKLAFMDLFSFASRKMSKGIAKSKRVIETINTRLEYIKHRKEFLKARLASYKSSAQDLVQSLLNLSSNECSENVKKSVNFSNLEIISRDNHQSVEYLQNLLKSLLSESLGSNKMAMLLLYAAKSFYLKLITSNIQDGDCKETFENIVKFLDSSQIEWADQKHTDESMHEEVVRQYFPSIPSLNIEYLSSLPHLQNFSLSPASFDALPEQRRSIMKGSSAYVTLPLSSHLTPIREKNSIIKQSALSFIEETEIDQYDIGESPNNEYKSEAMVKSFSELSDDHDDAHEALPVLNETFELLPVKEPECENKIDTVPSTGVDEERKMSESIADREIESNDLNGTFSISKNVPQTSNIEPTKTSVAMNTGILTKNIASNTKSFKNILKTSITPFKMPKTPVRLMTKAPLKTPSSGTKVPENRSIKKSLSVSNFPGLGSNTVKSNTVAKFSTVKTMVRNTSFRHPYKENIAPLRSSASSSRLLPGRATSKINDNTVTDPTTNTKIIKGKTYQEMHHNDTPKV